MTLDHTGTKLPHKFSVNLQTLWGYPCLWLLFQEHQRKKNQILLHHTIKSLPLRIYNINVRQNTQAEQNRQVGCD